MSMTGIQKMQLEIAGLREGLEIAEEGCREFVRLQKELCELLDEDSEGDSLVLHDRIVWGIKALRERAEGASPYIWKVFRMLRRNGKGWIASIRGAFCAGRTARRYKRLWR